MANVHYVLFYFFPSEMKFNGIPLSCNKRGLSSILHSLNGHSFTDPTEIKHPKNQNKAAAKNHQVLIPRDDSIFINQKMELILNR